MVSDSLASLAFIINIQNIHIIFRFVFGISNSFPRGRVRVGVRKNLVVGPLGPPKSSLWATLALFLGFGPLFPYFMGHTLDVWLGRLVFGPPILVCGPLLGHLTTFWATFAPFIGPLLGHFWATLVCQGTFFQHYCQ
jgi:hypothetical protein